MVSVEEARENEGFQAKKWQFKAVRLALWNSGQREANLTGQPSSEQYFYSLKF